MALDSISTISHTEAKLSLFPCQVEGGEWWRWTLAVLVTLALTAGMVVLSLFGEHAGKDGFSWSDLRSWVRGLVCLVVLFDIYILYQHLQLQRMRRRLAAREQLFRLISENAADLIAVVDNDGTRLYNSPAYQTVLGYSPGELSSTSSLEQVHTADRERVVVAAKKARESGRVQRLEYRIRHKNGSWRVLESTASPIRDSSHSIQGLVMVNRDITERKRAEEMLIHSAFYDGLTNLPNRILFADRLQHALTRSLRHSDYEFAVLLIDIDDFKVFNDSLGRASGDDLLIQIARRLAASFRDTDTLARTEEVDGASVQEGLARLGGDEFTVLLEDVLNPSDAIRVAERVQAKLAAPFAIRGEPIVISASIGVVSSKNSYANAEEVLRDGEIAMHRAKRTGRGGCELFDPAMHSRAVQRLRLENDLRKGLQNGELLVYYQPIVRLADGKIVSFEALSRWNRPSGLLSPAEFVPIADETGLIVPMNEALLRTACQQLRGWHEQLNDVTLTMSINLAPKQFSNPELPVRIEAILRETGIAPHLISLEIMETVAMEDAENALLILSQLKSVGVCLSIDDFGTGYSSLSRLPRLPIDALKIDRSFISNMHLDSENQEIVRLIVMLAHSMGLKVVAEGTETRNQIEMLGRMHCEMVQGYFYSPPINAESASRLLVSGATAAR